MTGMKTEIKNEETAGTGGRGLWGRKKERERERETDIVGPIA
jgi:hypothetical protein